uniref:Uncharacterized protein n=1 Tax=Opuntia streptacantha TaxID=393608 RepID=A0A7C9CZG3_OPUST
MAVLPTPGSPMRTGLFLVLLERIWIHLRISSSLPITGSSFPSLAIAVKSLPYFSSASYFPSGSWSMTDWRPLTTCIADRNVFSESWNSLNNCLPNLLSSLKARTKCSTDTKESPYSFLNSLAR